MDFYSLPASANYFAAISKFIVQRYSGALDKVQVIFSHPLQCQFFQKCLIDELKVSCDHCLLPQILPLSNLWEKFGVIKEEGNIYTRAKSLEAILCLSKNLAPNLNFTDSLQQACELHEVLKEIADNKLDTIDESVLLDKSIHLQEQLKLIISKNSELIQELKKQNKIPSYEFDNKLYTNYLSKYLSGPTIFVGLVRESKAFNQFLADNLSKEDWTFILPPINGIDDLELFSDSAKLLNYLNVNQISAIDKQQSEFTLKGFLNHNSAVKASHVSLLELDNEIEESNIIFLLIKDFLDRNPTQSVGLFLTNRNITNFITNNLKKYSIDFADFVGESFLENKLVQFILCVSNLLFDPVNIEKALSCIKHSFISCKMSSLVEQILRKNVLLSSCKQIPSYMEDNPELAQWWDDFYSKIDKYHALINSSDTHEFDFLLQINLQLTEEIYPDIWKIEHSEKIVAFFRDLLNTNFGLVKKEEFYDLIKYLLKRNRLISSNQNARVLILSPEQNLHLNCDMVILADMNGDIRSSNLEMWIAKSLRRNLNLGDIEFRLKMQDFYLLLCNKEVVLTRSKKVNNTVTSPSKFWQQVLHLSTQNKFTNTGSKKGYVGFLHYHFNSKASKPNPENFLVPPDCFPKAISATNVELLIKNPHGFYAKNILKLRPLDEINKQELNAEFGTLIHAIICAYNSSKHYDLESFLQIAHLELEKLKASEFITNLWWPKIAAIGEAYVAFSLTRYASTAKIYSEIYGEAHIELSGKKQKITAIADEILLHGPQDACIIDYKTGAPPSKKDVLSGLAPQLIVESLILQSGGFKGLPTVKPSEITFIKISHYEPYLQEISMQGFDLEKHYSGLTNLLQHYLSSKTCYYVLPHASYAPKYDQYRHLGRKNYFLYT